jgi:uncharacterized protein YbjQ (UPF0145 family)
MQFQLARCLLYRRITSLFFSRYNRAIWQERPMDLRMTSTAFELPGFRIKQNLGLVRGIVARSRSVVGNFVAGLQTIVGGNITIYTNLCEQARTDAFNMMMQHAREMGANAVIGIRYDANEITDGVTEVLCYGTAVFVEAVG